MIDPITPSDVEAAAVRPDAVIDIFNRLINAKWDGDRAVVLQGQVVGDLVELTGRTESYMIKHNWLDIESIYEAAGWRVEYNVSDPAELHRPTFTFTRRENNDNS